MRVSVSGLFQEIACVERKVAWVWYAGNSEGAQAGVLSSGALGESENGEMGAASPPRPTEVVIGAASSSKARFGVTQVLKAPPLPSYPVWYRWIG